MDHTLIASRTQMQSCMQVSLDAEDIRNEKVKVLRSMRKVVLDDLVMGQYRGRWVLTVPHCGGASHGTAKGHYRMMHSVGVQCSTMRLLGTVSTFYFYTVQCGTESLHGSAGNNC